MIRRPPRSTQSRSSAASDVYKRQGFLQSFDKNLEVYSAGTEASGKLSSRAVQVMHEIGIDISFYTSDPVEKYLADKWDYVITVCGGANEKCPSFLGKVKHRLHI